MSILKKIEKKEEQVINWMGLNGIYMLRVSIGIIFFWFGFQKFFPGFSTAEDLAIQTIDVMSLGIVKAPYSMPILAVWETAIGLGFIFGKYMRLTVILLYLQMVGTIFPLFVFPEETFHSVPFGPSIQGQYIIKNVIIITAAMVILAQDQGRKIGIKGLQKE